MTVPEGGSLDVPAYANNRLIEALGPIPSRKDMAVRLTYRPAVPTSVTGVPLHVRLHQMMALWELHVPTEIGLNVGQSLDLMLRQGLVYREPEDVDSWRPMYGHLRRRPQACVPMFAGALVGLSGSGKSVTAARTLDPYGQTYTHSSFPHLATPIQQLNFLHVDAPPSGKAADLAVILGAATNRALRCKRFDDDWLAGRGRGFPMLMEWLRFVASHFLGVLVLDEVENLFKIATLRTRRAAKAGDERPELRIVEDETLKFLHLVTNMYRIPVLAVGTHDGVAALNTRLSTAERIAKGGYHHLQPHGLHDPYYKRHLFPTLWNYQWLEHRYEDPDEMRTELHQLSAGVSRIEMLVWTFGQRCAIEAERKVRMLTPADLHRAMDTYLAPLRPAVEALGSNDPRSLARYEDLLPKDDIFWSQLSNALVAPLT